jgi:CrcB protein
MLNSIFAICIGASLGALSRWSLGLALNSIFPPVPIGTLAANLIGGYCIGLFMGIFSAFPSISPEWRLFVNTGFLGALTTFSTFSAEVTALLQQRGFTMAAGASALHLFGSLSMTLLGIATFTLIRQMLH